MTGTAATVQLCKTKGQYLLTFKVSRYCIIIFYGKVDVIGTVSMGRYSEACIGYIHTDFKIPVFIFRQQIYIILIYLLPDYKDHILISSCSNKNISRWNVNVKHLQTILAVKLKMINQDRMIFGDFSVNFVSISLKFRKGHFLLKS